MACADMIITFSGFRDESLKNQIEEAGGKVNASMTKTTTHLLIKKDGKSSKKIDEAKEKNIEILDLEEFLNEHKFHTTEKKTSKQGAAKKEENEESHDELESREEKPVKQLTDMEILAKIMQTLTTKEKKSDAIDALEILKTRINNI